MDLRQLAISHIKPTQENHYRRSRNDEGQSRQNASQESALQIANIDRQLERFGSRQHVTESHDLYKAIFRKPFPFLDHVIEHHRDLRHWSADVYKAKKEEVQKHLSPGRHLMFLISYAFEFAFLNSHSHLLFPSAVPFCGGRFLQSLISLIEQGEQAIKDNAGLLQTLPIVTDLFT